VDPRRLFSLRRSLFWLVIAAALWLVVSRFTEAEKLASTLAQGQWLWVLLAAAAEAGGYALLALVFQASFAATGVRSRWGHLVLVTLAAVVVNSVAPSGGAAGVALYADDAARERESAAGAVAGTLVASVADFTAFGLVLVLGLAYLFLYHDLRLYEVAAAAALLLFTGGQALLLFGGLTRPSLLARSLTALEHLLSRASRLVRRGSPLPDGWGVRAAGELTQAARAAWTHPRRLGEAALAALAVHVVDLGSLFCLFRAFHQPVSFGVLVAGYAIGTLFLNVSPIPQGIGVVEGTMTLVFVSLGVSTSVALVATLAFRGLGVWLPLLAGLFALRHVRTFRPEEGRRRGRRP